MKRRAPRMAVTLLVLAATGPRAAAPQQSDKIKPILDRAIQALGGETYLAVKDYSAAGRYYVIEEDRQGWTEFTDQSRLPSKVRQEMGKKGDKETSIFDLEAGKGWTVVGDTDIKPATPQQIEQFRLSNKHNLEILFRFRIKENGVSLHYYGSDILDGRKPVQIVELIDAENDSLRIAFEESSGLPYRLEYQETGKYGRRLRIHEEFSNWHVIQGVNTPMRVDRFTNGEPSSQVFINKIAYNVSLSDALFAAPAPAPKKKK